ncbi:MAG: outer membrane lipoprotein carrier protein LolA [Chitinophagales bacterium]|nr:outer membrane lipoprotein carrier protein LolA [Chitinophagales bacterium]MDW8428714.1 outer membrane lipoprotein carrier protein LolA [Chitinophagales bacterium]
MKTWTRGALCGVLLFSCSAAAQQNDPRATQILNSVSATYKELKSAQADFSIRIESPHSKTPDVQTGTLFIKGNKYKLSLKNQEVISDNVTVWTYLKEANEVQVSHYEPDENTITPIQLFTLYEKDFLYAFTEEKQMQGKTIQYIELTPLDKSKPYFKVRLGIDKATRTVQSAVVFDKNGNRYHFEIRNFVANPALADSFFQFDPRAYPGIEIVDLR